MSDPQLARAAAVFEAALGRAPEARAAFVDAACQGDEEIAREVHSLLRHHESAEGFLAEPAELPFEDLEREALEGSFVGRYKLLERLGAGGMGVVYLAEQNDPRRRVALKLLRPGLATREMLLRFAHEAQVLGRLSHPGIAQIHEAATTDGAHGSRPYFAMELVEGPPLTEYARQRELSLRRRIELLIDVCRAVQHAHQKGVVHRDLKPANILVDPAGRPKILDFGVARAVDADLQRSTRHTRVGEIVGTLAYMSPEQASGDPDLVDTRTDVYALGVLGYELLGGSPPFAFEDSSLLESVRVLREEEPPPLGNRGRELRGDLSTIFAQALEKERERRYGSAAALADDLRRYLDDEPIAARPPSRLYQLRKFAARNRGLVTSVASVVLLLTVATGVTARLALRLAAQRDDARSARQEAERQTGFAEAINSFLGDVLSAAEPGVGGRNASIADAIAAATEGVDERFAGQPALAAAVHAKLGKILFERGDPRAAGEQGRIAYEMLGALPGADPWALANSAALVGQAAALSGDLDRALEVLGHALELIERHGLEEDALFGAVLNELGAALLARGRYDDAEPVLRRAYEIRLALYGPGHAETVTSQNNLAILFLKTERAAQAEPLLAQILDAWEQLGTPQHPNAITAVYNYADVSRELGRYERAEDYFLQALERGGQSLPEGHWLHGLHRSRYGELLLEMGRPDEAEPLLVDGHARLSRALGEDHERTRRVERALARLRGAQRERD